MGLATMNQTDPRRDEGVPAEGEPSTPAPGERSEEPLDIERPLEYDEAVAPVDEDEVDAAFEDYDQAPSRRTVTLGRGAFLTMVTVGVLAIVALGAATTWLALDRRGSDDPVIATVNGEQIRRSEYDKAVAKNNGAEVLDNLVLEHLVEGEARKRNITVDDQETSRLLNEQKQQFGSDAAFQAALAQANLTETDLTRQLRLSAMLRQMVSDRIQVTDDEVNQTFTASPGQFADQTEAQAKEQIKSTLQRQKESTAARDLLDQLRGDAKIETSLPGKDS